MTLGLHGTQRSTSRPDAPPREYEVETGLAILAHTDPALVATFDGIESTDGYGAAREVLRTGVRPVEEELRREVDQLYDVARESVSAVWPSVKALVEALLVHEEVDRAGVDRAIGDADVCGPVFAVQRAHGLLPVSAQTTACPWTPSGTSGDTLVSSKHRGIRMQRRRHDT
jgi:hypothetical protein